MNRHIYSFRRALTLVLVGLLVGLAPAVSYVRPVSGEAASATAPVSTEAAAGQARGVTAPTGADAATYTYNASTGLWENEYYTWNPATYATAPKQPAEYTYNPVSGLWDALVWQYLPSSGAYRQVAVSVQTPPAGAITHGGPAAIARPKGEDAPSESSGSTTVAPELTVPAAHGETTPEPSGSSLQSATSAAVTNRIDSAARSGNGQMLANTTAGNLASGDALAVANVINLLQSQASLSGGSVATFTANIDGNLQGDFLIDPAALAQPAAIAGHDLSGLTINHDVDGRIHNDVTIDAVSGGVLAGRNTTSGDVSSGDAHAVANVLNLINSAVAANQSFVGVINIDGDYSGNILLPAASLDSLLATAGSQPGPEPAALAGTSIESTVDQTIINSVDLASRSGDATLDRNTTAGEAASGDALTNLTILNLTGRQVTAENSLLVFVNVLGSWVGLIMDAPAGTSAAALGGDVSNDEALLKEAETQFNEQYVIENDILVRAESGDATATENTTVGSVTTGRATASANIANINYSSFSLSDWFGVLFINVFGNWRGNFGLAPAPAQIGSSSSGDNVRAGNPSPVRLSGAKVFRFVTTPQQQGSVGLAPAGDIQRVAGVNPDEPAEDFETMIVTEVIEEPVTDARSSGEPRTAGSAAVSVNVLPIALGLMGFTIVGIDRVRSKLHRKSLRRLI